MTALTVVFPALQVHGADAELVWPWDEWTRPCAARTAGPETKPDFPAWPKSLRELCGDSAQARRMEITAGAGAYPIARKYPLSRPFETFGNTWVSHRVDPELAESWRALPPIAEARLGYPVTEHSYLFVRLALRRDFRYWAGDRAGGNVPFSDREVDLNEPTLGYFHAESDAFSLTVGRFPVHWSPSPEYGLALSGSVPFHDGAEASIRIPHLRYRFLVSSLNPWLEGTPAGDSSSNDFPPGSEEYRQRHYPAIWSTGPMHNRVYAEPIKTLLAHRLEFTAGPIQAGLTEMTVVGGKPPDFRDANPFGIHHNDFKQGPSSSAVSMDAYAGLPGGFSLIGELFLDDLAFAATEGYDSTPSLIGWTLALRHRFSAGAWHTDHSAHLIFTDPFLYGYVQPYNTLYARRVIASNHGTPSDAVQVDRFVVDYPLGYVRGGDAFDLRYRAEARRGADWRVVFTADWLRHGEVGYYTPYLDYYAGGHATPSGTEASETRMRLDAMRRVGRGVSVGAGAGWQRILNEANQRGRDVTRAQLSAGLTWSLGE